MSMLSARAFIKRMGTDNEFKRKVNECKDEKSRMDFVTSHGFDFSKEEIELVKSELSEEEISNLSGGGSNSCLVHIGVHPFYV
ncbi:MAG: Nif11-like leader peptide family natural product precursor [Candidatus Eremiobacterota bacterium]